MKIINIDGPDGVGKSTLVDGLIKHFRESGKVVDFVHFPRYNTDIGQLIREVLFLRTRMDPKSLQMLYSADRLNFTKFELPELENKLDYLLVDRYGTSGFVYGQVDGLYYKDLLFFEKENAKTDINLILLTDIETLLQRISNKETDMYENKATLAKALEIYKDIHIHFQNTSYLDATNSKDKVLEDAIYFINRIVG